MSDLYRYAPALMAITLRNEPNPVRHEALFMGAPYESDYARRKRLEREAAKRPKKKDKRAAIKARRKAAHRRAR